MPNDPGFHAPARQFAPLARLSGWAPGCAARQMRGRCCAGYLPVRAVRAASPRLPGEPRLEQRGWSGNRTAADH